MEGIFGRRGGTVGVLGLWRIGIRSRLALGFQVGEGRQRRSLLTYTFMLDLGNRENVDAALELKRLLWKQQ